MIRLNLKRLRYLVPVVLAAFCLARGVTLTGAFERSRAATVRLSAALLELRQASNLIAELRFGTDENFGVRMVGSRDEWQALVGKLEQLGREPSLGGAELERQIIRTSALVDAAVRLAPAKAPKEIQLESSLVWAGWQRLETSLMRRLSVELAGPGDQAASVALLAALGCLACALLLWQTWHSAELRGDAALVEGSLRDSEARLRAMSETSREILIQADPSGRILRVNARLAANDMPGLLAQPEMWEHAVAEIGQGGASPRPVREVWLQPTEAGSRLAEWRVFPVRDTAGHLVRIDSAFLDVTAAYTARQSGQARTLELEQTVQKLQRQLRELLEQSFELTESRAELKRAAEARMESLRNWGHRVAQPLGQASALTSRLRTNAGSFGSDEAAALVQAVDSVAASLRALADFAGLERGPFDVEACEFSPRSLVEDAVEAVAGRTESKHLEMPCFVDQRVPGIVVADVRRLGDVLRDVLDHALAHTSCGEVSVRLATASRAGTTANLRFEVEDTGAGYSAAGLAAAFEPFHPALPSNGVISKLAHAKHVVERMGGQFGIQSESGQGTRVWFLVPTEIPAGVAPESAAPAELAGRRALIVYDEASQRGALVELAQALGLEACACASCEPALAQLHAAVAELRPFDFVLIDYELPGTKGPGLAGLIASEPDFAASAAFLMVPYSLRTLCEDPSPPGLSGVISKPVRLSSLARLLTGRGQEKRSPLPISPAPAADVASRPHSARQESRPAMAAGSPVLLIVEDNLVNQRVAARLVEKMGYRAAVVNNGLEAIQAVQREHYDLILMDCQMPELDGFTATAEIRRLEKPGSHMPVIAMTANAMRGDREKCLAAGMDDYVSKPVAFEDLRVLVTRWLARAGVARL